MEKKKLRNAFVNVHLETEGPFKGRWLTVRCRPVQGRRKIGTFDDPFSFWSKKEAAKLAEQLIGRKGFPNPRAVRFGPGWTVGWGDLEILSNLRSMSHEELGKAFGISAKDIRAHVKRISANKSK